MSDEEKKSNMWVKRSTRVSKVPIRYVDKDFAALILEDIPEEEVNDALIADNLSEKSFNGNESENDSDWTLGDAPTESEYDSEEKNSKE